MLYLKSNEEKKLVFEIDIHGCNTEELQGFVRFEIYGAEYGFPVLVEDRKITAVVPPLKEIVEKDIEDGTIVNARLDMITERHYFMPWAGEVKVGAPMDIKAKIKEDEKGSRPGVKTTLLTSGSTSPRVVAAKEDKQVAPVDEDDRIDRLEKMMGMLLEGIKKGKPTGRKTAKAVKVSRQQLIQEKKEMLKEQLKDPSKKDIYGYMWRAGTRNTKIQNLIYEQATSNAKSNFDILKNVVRILKKKRR